jgi:hypothetical protein
VPNHRRNRPSRTAALVWAAALVATAAFSASLGTSTVRAEDEPLPEETPQVSISPTDMPEPPIQCSGSDSAGPVPSGSQSITGTVTDGVDPVTDLQVRLTSTAGGQHTTFTNASGEYLFELLGDGTYFVSFYDANATYSSGFYDGAGPTVLDKAEATGVVLDGNGATGIDAALAPETFSSITGRVTASDDSFVADALVSVRGAFFPLVGCASTSGTGLYEITNLRSGVYIAVAEKGGLPNAPYASTVTVPPSASGIDFQFPEVHTLSGTVLDGNLNPIDNISVTACETTTNECGSGDSGGGTGSFDIPGLVAGSYVLRYQDSSGNNLYRSGYYGGEGVWVETAAEAVAVTVPGGPVELRVVPAPTVSGTITAPGAPASSVLVSLCDANQDNCFAGYIDEAVGTYSVGIPVPGTYFAQVFDYSGTYPSGGYIGAGATIVQDASEALEVVVGGSSVTAIDATLPQGGRIAATLTAGGVAVPFDYVEFCRSEFACPDAMGTDENGVATSPAMFPGTYYVKAHNADFTTEYWYVLGDVGSPDFAEATAVDVLAGQTDSVAIDIPLAGTPTDAGDDVEPVTVAPDDGTGNTPVEITFADVESSGTTTVTVSESGNPVPDGFQLGLPTTYFDISTTAGVVAPITICISYAGVSYANESTIRLFHYEGDPPAWEDITTSRDTVNDVICGVSSSLSPFVLAEPTMTFTGFFQPVDNGALNKAKAGAGVPVKFSLGGDFGLDVFADGYPSVRPISCSTGVPVDEIEQTVSVGSESSLEYDAATDRYVYRFKTSKSWAGTCQRLTMAFSDGTIRTADFTFKK